MEVVSPDITIVSPKVFEYQQVYSRNGSRVEFIKGNETKDSIEFIRYTINQSGKKRKTGKISFSKIEESISYMTENWPVLSLYTVNMDNAEKGYYKYILEKIKTMEE